MRALEAATVFVIITFALEMFGYAMIAQFTTSIVAVAAVTLIAISIAAWVTWDAFRKRESCQS